MKGHGVAITVFVVLFALVSVLGFAAARWRRADNMDSLEEWGLGGRGFGTFITWFLLGGDLYTAYTFIAVPGAMYATGAVSGWFAVPYTILVYPFVFLIMPRLWSVSHRHGYVTPADFVRGRYDSRWLALAVAVTGLLATMPYIALQLVGIQSVLEVLGLGGSANANGFVKDLPLLVAFVILAAYTYSSGLRAPALIAFVKDFLIYVVVIVAIIYIPYKLGGFHNIFDAAQRQFASPAGVAAKASFVPSPKAFFAYGSLALGSAFALFLYPHSVTAVLSTKNRDIVRRNAAILPAYSLLLGLIALLGFMAIAAGIKTENSRLAVPLLFDKMFPGWFTGVAFAAIAIGALVPAAIMSIAASNLFTRNIYREFFRRDATIEHEAAVSKLVSLVVKLGALMFIFFLNLDYTLNLQLLGGVWILQTFPAIVIGLYTRWFHRWALLLGWAAGMIYGTLLAYNVVNATGKHFAGSVAPALLGADPTAHKGYYAAITALVLNLIVAGVATVVLRAAKVSAGTDQTTPSDYVADADDPKVEAIPELT